MGNRLAISLRHYRRIHGLKQDDIARLLNADRTIISKLERGTRKLTVEQLIALCAIYGHDVPPLCRLLQTELTPLLLERICLVQPKARNQIRTKTIDALHARLTTSPLLYEHTS